MSWPLELTRSVMRRQKFSLSTLSSLRGIALSPARYVTPGLCGVPVGMMYDSAVYVEVRAMRYDGISHKEHSV
jgi:hypothetical protein